MNLDMLNAITDKTKETLRPIIDKTADTLKPLMVPALAATYLFSPVSGQAQSSDTTQINDVEISWNTNLDTQSKYLAGGSEFNKHPTSIWNTSVSATKGKHTLSAINSYGRDLNVPDGLNHLVVNTVIADYTHSGENGSISAGAYRIFMDTDRFGVPFGDGAYLSASTDIGGIDAKAQFTKGLKYVDGFRLESWLSKSFEPVDGLDMKATLGVGTKKNYFGNSFSYSTLEVSANVLDKGPIGVDIGGKLLRGTGTNHVDAFSASVNLYKNN